MPFKEQIISPVLFKNENGEKVCTFNKIKEIEIDSVPKDPKPVRVFSSEPVTINLNFSDKQRKKLERIFIVGWRAKGPVRKRLLEKEKMKYILWKRKKYKERLEYLRKTVPLQHWQYLTLLNMMEKG